MPTGPDYELRGVTVVVRGQFNPAIFSPLWLRHQDLIGSAEYEAAEIGVVTREFTSFEAGWLNCQVSLDSFSLSTTDLDETERLRDAVAGTLRTLSHTPIGALGINVETHLRLPDVASWHRVGDVLAPKEVWSASLRLPGMRSVSIMDVRPDLYQGAVNVTVEPSVKVAHGIFVSCNDHYELVRAERLVESRSDVVTPQPLQSSADKIPIALEILNTGWADSLARADAVLQNIWRVSRGEIR